MSVFNTMALACPSCGEKMDFEAVASVNADRRPDLRDEIVDGTFQRTDCPKCGVSFRLDPDMVYLDIGRGQWIAVFPATDLGDWEGREAQARDSFARAYGDEASPAAKAIGGDLHARVAFGWAALREKLLATQHGLDDKLLELMKIAMIRGLENPPLGDGSELRLVEVDEEEDSLILAWIQAQDESVIEMMKVPRSLYDEIAEDGEGWDALRDSVAAGMFVDMQRLFIEAP